MRICVTALGSGSPCRHRFGPAAAARARRHSSRRRRDARRRNTERRRRPPHADGHDGDQRPREAHDGRHRGQHVRWRDRRQERRRPLGSDRGAYLSRVDARRGRRPLCLGLARKHDDEWRGDWRRGERPPRRHDDGAPRRRQRRDRRHAPNRDRRAHHGQPGVARAGCFRHGACGAGASGGPATAVAVIAETNGVKPPM